MLTADEVRDELLRISYKDGWRFRLLEHPYEGHVLRIEAKVPDAYDPSSQTTLGIDSFLPPIATRRDLWAWLIWRIIRIESHEAREFFKVDGDIVFDPHKPQTTIEGQGHAAQVV